MQIGISAAFNVRRVRVGGMEVSDRLSRWLLLVVWATSWSASTLVRETRPVNLDLRVQERLVALLAKGDALHGSTTPGYMSAAHCDKAQLAEWKAQAGVVLESALGSDHHYTAAFKRALIDPASSNQRDDVTIDAVDRGQGVLRAVLEDVAGGHLFSARALIEAEVFSDFIEMSRHLIAAGYKDPAASLAGAVLEDGLRKLARSRGVEVRPRDGINELNEALAKAGVYNAIVKSRVDGWRLVRNKADHGEFDEYDRGTVVAMIDGVAELLAAELC